MSKTPKIIAREILDKDFPQKRIIISQRKKNLDFMKKNNISEKEAIEIVKDLTIDVFDEKRKNKDRSIKADYLYIFKPLININDEYGRKIERMYIKICNVKDNIYTVSFHENDSE